MPPHRLPKIRPDGTVAAPTPTPNPRSPKSPSPTPSTGALPAYPLVLREDRRR
jgi:hypothetical protein